MPGKLALIFGGTAEARHIASALIADGFETMTSLAGGTKNPIHPEGGIHRGSLGGTTGIAAFAQKIGAAAIIDATHPFAAVISRHARAAAAAASLPYFHFEREPWHPEPGDQWFVASDMENAATILPVGARVMLTVGRKEIWPFISRKELSGLARMIEPPPTKLPFGWALLLERPPFDVAHESGLLTRFEISHLVCKNSGGETTRAKLVAAREKRIPVIMIERPTKPEIPTFCTVESLLPALRRALYP
jgi:precorrin-6A/cobalt-precorrin-6A reductase